MLGLVVQNLCLIAFIARLNWQNEADVVRVTVQVDITVIVSLRQQ